MGLHHLKCFCTVKKTMRKNEKTAYWMGEDVWKLHIQKGVNIKNIKKTHTIQSD